MNIFFMIYTICKVFYISEGCLFVNCFSRYKCECFGKSKTRNTIDGQANLGRKNEDLIRPDRIV